MTDNSRMREAFEAQATNALMPKNDHAMLYELVWKPAWLASRRDALEEAASHWQPGSITALTIRALKGDEA